MTKAIIIAGTQSGAGKTTVTLGIMAALVRMGKKVQPFKCGPDFIDPSLHQLVTGIESRNLDLWMAGEAFTLQTFARHCGNADIAVIEGVMGMYDGGESSSAALAEHLHVPVILVLDVQSQAESAAAVLNGFENLSPATSLKGVILNRVASPRHLQLVTDAIRKYCQAKILGYVPRNVKFQIPERHLGLHMGDENPLRSDAIHELAETIQKYVDLEGLLEMATIAESTPVEQIIQVAPVVRIAVARDKAFCFYYEDNLDLLRQAGAELVFFSPLDDKGLPANINGIYLGGGYPELYAEQLSSNRGLLSEIKEWAEDNGIIYAECGGFMYLTQGIIDLNDQFHTMADIFPFQTQMQQSRASLGYRQIILKKDSLFGSAGTVMRGHEFHYSTIVHAPERDDINFPEDIHKIYTVNNNAGSGCGTEGYCYKNVLGGYLHLHFGFNLQTVETLVEKLQTGVK